MTQPTATATAPPITPAHPATEHKHEPAVRVEGVVKSSGAVRAADGADLDIARGATTAAVAVPLGRPAVFGSYAVMSCRESARTA